MTHPDEFRLDVEQRHAAGQSVNEIAAAVGRSYNTVYALVRRRHGVRMRAFGDLSRLRFLVRKGLIP